MYCSYGLLLLLLIETILIYCAIIKRQRFALWILLSGGGVLGFLGVTIYFNISFPYEYFRLNIYLVFFLSVMLMFAGIMGMFTKILRRVLRRE